MDIKVHGLGTLSHGMYLLDLQILHTSCVLLKNKRCGWSSLPLENTVRSTHVHIVTVSFKTHSCLLWPL